MEDVALMARRPSYLVQAERESKRHQRELEKRRKEEAKLSALEQAQLAVETHENEIEVLLSVHKEASVPMDWDVELASLPPAPPSWIPQHELNALMAYARRWRSTDPLDGNDAATEGYNEDQGDYDVAVQTWQTAMTEWQQLKDLAARVKHGDAQAYIEAVLELSSISEISAMGSGIGFTVHGPRLIECQLNVKGKHIIPAEARTLTTTGKLSSKAMPKARFQEIYQDHVCSCVLRLAREMFALLPVDMVLVTASVTTESVSLPGSHYDIPVVSVAFDRPTFHKLDFQNLDPSDSLDHFTRRGDVQSSRKTGEFISIVPLTAEELLPPGSASAPFSDLLGRLQQQREAISRSALELDKLLSSQSFAE